MTHVGSMPHCIPVLCCLLSHSHFPPLPSGLLYSGCEYWCWLCGHDGKGQLEKTGEPACGSCDHSSAEPPVCTALKRFSTTLQSIVQPQEQRLYSDRNWMTSFSDGWEIWDLQKRFKENLFCPSVCKVSLKSETHYVMFNIGCLVCCVFKFCSITYNLS